MNKALKQMLIEFAAKVVSDRPDRFGFFATLTLPDVEGAITKAVSALDELQASGVVLLANTHGHYLGETAFDPLMEALTVVMRSSLSIRRIYRELAYRVCPPSLLTSYWTLLVRRLI